MDRDKIRNFCILAHIDHGKSTLADRFLELTGTVEKRKMREQYLDMNPLEREKGITIKMQPVRMEWGEYILNLIDTPGHVDFTYEVSRALAAVEGALLLVDATQGVQAQTIANLHLALEQKLVIIPVINKIDLPSAEVAKAAQEIVELLGVEPDEILKISAKTGEGVEDLLRVIVEKIPPPKPSGGKPLCALIFDSLYDPYQGIIAHVRIGEGRVKAREKIFFLASGTSAEVAEVGIFTPQRMVSRELSEGEIGYIATGIKELEQVRVGDTIGSTMEVEPLPGYREPMPMVFASVFPENQDEYEQLRDALKKLKLNDAALSFEPEAVGFGSLGRGFRVGFLGMLHMEIISERLSREYELSLVFSNPSVAFHVYGLRKTIDKTIETESGEEYRTVYSAMKMPDRHEISRVEEPWVAGEIIAPARFLGALTTLVHERTGMIHGTLPLAGERLLVRFDAPLREIIVDFHDVLKSISSGFASFSYVLGAYRFVDVVRLDILVAGEKVPAFSEIVPADRAYAIGRLRVQKLKELLPRELFTIALQAQVEGRVLARETIAAMSKDVTGYLYGGDRTRKMKLWKKQQAGKKRLKAQAQVEISSDIFLKMMKR
ncbi:MAG: elongation factor 4 [Candidatus Sungbacteria bacterium]|nr:elongation factor 4 [Candidatus Sungbacteria bacterium]